MPELSSPAYCHSRSYGSRAVSQSSSVFLGSSFAEIANSATRTTRTTPLHPRQAITAQREEFEEEPDGSNNKELSLPRVSLQPRPRRSGGNMRITSDPSLLAGSATSAHLEGASTVQLRPMLSSLSIPITWEPTEFCPNLRINRKSPPMSPKEARISSSYANKCVGPGKSFEVDKHRGDQQDSKLDITPSLMMTDKNTGVSRQKAETDCVNHRTEDDILIEEGPMQDDWKQSLTPRDEVAPNDVCTSVVPNGSCNQEVTVPLLPLLPFAHLTSKESVRSVDGCNADSVQHIQTVASRRYRELETTITSSGVHDRRMRTKTGPHKAQSPLRKKGKSFLKPKRRSHPESPVEYFVFHPREQVTRESPPLTPPRTPPPITTKLPPRLSRRSVTSDSLHVHTEASSVSRSSIHHDARHSYLSDDGDMKVDQGVPDEEETLTFVYGTLTLTPPPALQRIASHDSVSTPTSSACSPRKLCMTAASPFWDHLMTCASLNTKGSAFANGDLT